MKRLKNSVAWISGATSGIGEATARLFANEGASVAVVGRRTEKAKVIAEEIISQGGKAVALTCDVSDPEQVKKSIKDTVSAFGKLNILVNNSGMVDVRQLHEYSSEDWDYVMNVNVRSMYLAFKEAYPFLKKSSRSYVVNIGSISTFVGQAGTPVYTASKHAILGLSRSIAIDYASIGVRCNCVCPGITNTPMLREHLNSTGDPDKTLSKRLERVPMGVALTPLDVAKSIRFFSCEDSSGVTGTSLVIDCGYLTAAEWDSSPGTAFQT